VADGLSPPVRRLHAERGGAVYDLVKTAGSHFLPGREAQPAWADNLTKAGGRGNNAGEGFLFADDGASGPGHCGDERHPSLKMLVNDE
jgi:hypothetical protein